LVGKANKEKYRGECLLPKASPNIKGRSLESIGLKTLWEALGRDPSSLKKVFLIE
jgi:hypothetical protein